MKIVELNKLIIMQRMQNSRRERVSSQWMKDMKREEREGGREEVEKALFGAFFEVLLFFWARRLERERRLGTAGMMIVVWVWF